MIRLTGKVLRVILAISFIVTLSDNVLAQEESYSIGIDFKNYDYDSLYLGYYLGNAQYLRDTAVRGQEDLFVFEGDKPLAPGVYIVVTKPDNSFFQLIISDSEQDLKLKADAGDPAKTLECKDCKDNQLFYDYMSFLSDRRAEADSLRNLSKDESAAEGQKEMWAEALNRVDEEVRAYQEKVVSENPETVSAAIIKAGWEPEVPDFEEAGAEQQKLQYLYYKAHYFDNIDLADKRLLRTPLLFNKVNNYVERLTVQHPDSINRSLDTILMNMIPNPDAFQYYLVHYLNKYAKSKIVGMDAVYVHLVDQYYRTGLADWTNETQLRKILDNANDLKPILIGKQAPDITLEDREGNKVRLYDIESDYTILYFWRPDCPHCKKSTPFMIDFYKEYRDKGVELLSICMKFTDEVPSCWQYVDSKEDMDIFYNLVDPYHRSKFAKLYNVKSTPQIFVLDNKKEIVTKRIGAEQLKEVMDQIMQWDKEHPEEEDMEHNKGR